MKKSTTTLRYFIGTCLLAAILVFGITGIAKEIYYPALDSDEPSYALDALYIEECGACHLAYPPGLLPAQSWRTMLENLDQHFDDNAELDQKSQTHINNYLTQQALQKGNTGPMSRMLRNLPTPAPLRITELPTFINDHSEIAQRLGGNLDQGFFSPCADCHDDAASGWFSKDNMNRGYGPGYKEQQMAK